MLKVKLKTIWFFSGNRSTKYIITHPKGEWVRWLRTEVTDAVVTQSLRIVWIVWQPGSSDSLNKVCHETFRYLRILFIISRFVLDIKLGRFIYVQFTSYTKGIVYLKNKKLYFSDFIPRNNKKKFREINYFDWDLCLLIHKCLSSNKEVGTEVWLGWNSKYLWFLSVPWKNTIKTEGISLQRHRKNC